MRPLLLESQKNRTNLALQAMPENDSRSYLEAYFKKYWILSGQSVRRKKAQLACDASGIQEMYLHQSLEEQCRGGDNKEQPLDEGKKLQSQAPNSQSKIKSCPSDTQHRLSLKDIMEVKSTSFRARQVCGES